MLHVHKSYVQLSELNSKTDAPYHEELKKHSIIKNWDKKPINNIWSLKIKNKNCKCHDTTTTTTTAAAAAAAAAVAAAAAATTTTSTTTTTSNNHSRRALLSALLLRRLQMKWNVEFGPPKRIGRSLENP